MVASNDVDDNKHVSSSDEPSGFLEGNEDVILNRVSKHPVSDDGHRKVAQKNDGVGHPNSLHHGFVGRLLRRGRDGGLNLQHHVVAGVGERHVSQGAEELEHSSYVEGGVPEGHDGGGDRDDSDGVETGEMREDQVSRTKDHDEIGSSDGRAGRADGVVELLEGGAAGDHVFALLKPEILLHIEPRTSFIITVAVFLASSAFIKLDHFMILHNSGAVAPLTAVGITTLVVFQDRLLRKGKFDICGMSKPNGVAQVASEQTQWGSSIGKVANLISNNGNRSPPPRITLRKSSINPRAIRNDTLSIPASLRALPRHRPPTPLRRRRFTRPATNFGAAPTGAAAVVVTATWIFIPLGEQLNREIIEADLRKLRSSDRIHEFPPRSSFNAVAGVLAERKAPREPAETPRSAFEAEFVGEVPCKSV
nr:hypothetical protein CK203_077047 [Ipomoea batatas]